MEISYFDILGEQKTVSVKITTEHWKSEYGEPVLILENGNILDFDMWNHWGCKPERYAENELILLEKWVNMQGL